MNLASKNTLSPQGSLSTLKGIGPKTQAHLNHLGIQTIADLLFHLPLRYDDRTRIVPIGALLAGEHAVIEGTILCSNITFGRKRQLKINVEDASGVITLIFFHFNQAQQQQLTEGKKIRCFGEARLWGRALSMTHPEYQIMNGEKIVAVDERLSPIYPTTEGLQQKS